MTTADVLILGLGGMGTATAWQLARRGASVIGFDQFEIGHDQGSSRGHTRIIRQAYYEHPDYVPLVREAYNGWYDLEQSTGKHLLTSCPCLTLGPPDSELVQGVLRSAEEHHLPVERLSRCEVSERFRAFDLTNFSEVVGVVESLAGFLFVDECVIQMARQARRLGATLREKEHVDGWSHDSGEIVVSTQNGEYRGKKLIITAGPWSPSVLGSLGNSLRVMRQVALWHASSRPELFRRDRFPIFICETSSGYFYGIPAVDELGVKVARHYGASELPSIDGIDRSVHDADLDSVRDFLRNHLPAVDGPLRASSVCIYTLTPDRHFLIDYHPDHEGIIVAAGFSGHGFKFAPVVGQILADLALDQKSSLPIDLFRIRGRC